MTRPTVLDMDLIVVPREATVEMQVSGNSNADQSPEAVFSAMLSASPYPTAWYDVRKHVEGLARTCANRDAANKELYDVCVSHATRADAAEARIAELEADHLDERLAMSGRIEFLEDASAVPHLEHRIAELEKEKHAALTMIAMVEKRLADAERDDLLARGIIARAQQNTPDHYSNWHDAARAYMEGKTGE